MSNVRNTVTYVINGDTRGLENSLSTVNTRLSGLNTALSNVFNVAAIVAFGSAVTSAVASIGEAGMKVQTATIGLTTLLKDSATAATVVQRTMEDAAKTPFSFDALLKGKELLIAAGRSANQASIEIMDVGNAIAATGGNDEIMRRVQINMAQIYNKGKADARDIKEFANANINIIGLARKAHIQAYDAAGKVKLTYEDIVKILRIAREEGGAFANGLEAMNKSVQVQMSNIRDTVDIIKNNLFEAFLPKTSAVLGFLNSALQGLKDITYEMSRQKEVGLDWAYYMDNVFESSKNESNAFQILKTGTGRFLTSGLYGGAALVTTALRGIIPEETVELTRSASMKASYDFYNTISDVNRENDKKQAAYKLREQAKSVKDATDYSTKFTKGSKEQIAAENKANADRKQFYIDSMDATTKGLITPDQLKNIRSQARLGTNLDNTSIPPIPPKPPYPDNTKTSQVTGTKVVNINIKIDNMVKEMTFQTTNMKDSADTIKREVTIALTSALTDAQMMLI